jgi:hypothetical protein
VAAARNVLLLGAGLALGRRGLTTFGHDEQCCCFVIDLVVIDSECVERKKLSFTIPGNERPI